MRNMRMQTRYFGLMEMNLVILYLLFVMIIMISFKGRRRHEWHRTQRQDCVCGPSSEEDGAAGGAEEEV